MDPLIAAALLAAILASLGWLYRQNIALRTANSHVIDHEVMDDAKDELIATLKTNHEALVARVGILEARAGELDDKLLHANEHAEELRVKLADTLTRYDELAQYAAPEAVKYLQEMFQTFGESINALLHHVMERLVDVETTTSRRITENTDAIREMAVALRDNGADRRREDKGVPVLGDRRTQGESAH